MIKIYRPVRTNLKTQGFGESKACAQMIPPWYNFPVRPFKIKGKVNGVCPAGYADFYAQIGLTGGHNGEDWTTFLDESIFFPVDNSGTTWTSKYDMDADGGIGLDVYSDAPVHFDALPKGAGPEGKKQFDKNGGNIYVKFRFWHAHRNTALDGAKIAPGTYIQDSNSTGASSGNHLHWAMKIVDKNGVTLDKGNGFAGAVDFSPWFVNRFIIDVLVEKSFVHAVTEDMIDLNKRLEVASKNDQNGILDAIKRLLLLVRNFYYNKTGSPTNHMEDNKIPVLLRSSASPEKFSLTVKSLLLALVPIAIAVFGIDGGDANQLVNSIVNIVFLGTSLLAALGTTRGLLRKIIKNYQ